MGEFATAVQTRLCDAPAERRPARAWETEHRIAGTPVDIAGRDDRHLVVVELEWRRADPADNAAKLFRHLAAGEVETTVTVVHVFTEYYDLARGGVSAKRENAAFVGQMAADTFDRMGYTVVEFPLDPPKRGGAWPADWAETTDAVAETISDEIGN